MKTWQIIGTTIPNDGIRISAKASDGTEKFVTLAGPVGAADLASALRNLADTIDQYQRQFRPMQAATREDIIAGYNLVMEKR